MLDRLLIAGLLCTVLFSSRCMAAGADPGVPCVFRDWQARVDNFDALNTRTFSQRYCVNDTFASSPTAPVFLFLGGEAPVEFFNFQQVTFYSSAAQFGALAISLEHRYYGLSMPTPSLTTSDMAYLSSQQALADAALFLTNGPLGALAPNRKVIVWGCSYSGALSAFFRSKYAHLVTGSVAPSGPVQAINNFTQFLNQFQASVSDFAGCADAVATATAQIHDVLVSGNPAALAELSEAFQLCTPVKPQDDPFFFEYNLAQFVGTADQFNNPPAWPLRTTCALLVNGTLNATTPVQRFAEAAKFNQLFDPSVNAVGPEPSCYRFNDQAAYIKDGLVPGSSRSWWWQSCTEYGFFQGSYPGNDVFFPNTVIPVERIDAFCTEWFPSLTVEQVLLAIDQTNIYFGAKDLPGDQIVFANGNYDPLHSLSITEPVIASGQEQIAALTYQAGHCAIMNAPTDQDPADLVAARKSL